LVVVLFQQHSRFTHCLSERMFMKIAICINRANSVEVSTSTVQAGPNVRDSYCDYFSCYEYRKMAEGHSVLSFFTPQI